MKAYLSWLPAAAPFPTDLIQQIAKYKDQGGLCAAKPKGTLVLKD